MSSKERLLYAVDQCTKSQKHKFKRLYGGDGYENFSVEEIVSKLDEHDITFAIAQANRTIELNRDKIELKLKKLINKIK